MRVIHVITRLIVGGAQENTIASVLGLRLKPGLDVSLISGPTSGPEGSVEPLLAPTPEVLTRIPELVRPVRPWKDLLALQRLAAIFRSRRPDIVHTHSGKAGFLGRLAAARAKVPIIIHTVHGPSFGAFAGPVANTLFRTAEKFASRVTTHFVVVADAMKTQYVAAGIGRPDRYTKILSGFDIEPFLSAKNNPELRLQLGLDPGDIVIGKIARLFKLKGHDDLLALAPRLVRSYPQLRFLLVGDGPWRRKFEHQARSLGLQRHFVFTGLVPPNAVPGLIGVMDILLHLSTREGLARALPQALAAGKPVVAYDSDGAAEVCRENETGFLVKPGDFDALHDRLIQLARDAKLRNELGRHGQELVADRFTVGRMVEDLHELYLRLADNAGLSVRMTTNQHS